MAEPRVPTDPSGRPLPPQATMGLLNYLTATALDEDYAHVSARRRAAGPDAQGRRGGRGWGRGRLAWIALAAFGLLVVTAAVQTARTEPVRESSREALIKQIEQGRTDLADIRAERDRLDREVAAGRTDLLGTTQKGRALTSELDRLGVASGAVAVTGPGIQVVVDDGPGDGTKEQVLDTDLQILVNGLWSAGAEAVAVNGQRVTSLTAIRKAGDAITVNYRSLSAPYTVSAIGDPDQLGARFVESDAASWWFNLKSLYGLRFDVEAKDELSLPAAAVPRLRDAHPLEQPQTKHKNHKKEESTP